MSTLLRPTLLKEGVTVVMRETTLLILRAPKETGMVLIPLKCPNKVVPFLTIGTVVLGLTPFKFRIVDLLAMIVIRPPPAAQAQMDLPPPVTLT